MRVTIHYRGTLDDLGQIDDLQRELASIEWMGYGSRAVLSGIVSNVCGEDVRFSAIIANARTNCRLSRCDPSTLTL